MAKARPNLTVIGAGYVGLTTAIAAAMQGHQVHVIETNPERVADVRRGRAPFYEPGLEEALARSLRSRRLSIDTHNTSVPLAPIVMLCVGTPPLPSGAADLTFLDQAAYGVGRKLTPGPSTIVVVKSTVLPGTTQTVVHAAVKRGADPKARFEVASNPEFLREGSALKDALEPDRIVVGADSVTAARVVLSLYKKVKCPKITVNVRTAETIKYAANAFLALKIGFSNEMANLCERVGVDWYDVIQGLAPDPRIGGLFLRAGAGFGGSCFPKDVAALRSAFRKEDIPSPILDAVLDGNDRQPLVAVDLLRQEVGPLQGKRIALLGLAFKPDTDDVRETRALPILRALAAEGAHVVCHDPKAGPNFRKIEPTATLVPSVAEALRGAAGCIVQTEWDAYRRITPRRFRELMDTPVVVDGRRTYDAAKMKRAGIRYRAIGLGRATME